jgi:hypothetical protein
MLSHPDGETFDAISRTSGGVPERSLEDARARDVIDAQDGIKHAWRNSSEIAASVERAASEPL